MLISSKRLWQDRFYAVKHYYKSPKFALIDLTFGLIALFSNPYRTCRKFLQKKGSANIYAYGETPFATYQKIAELCQVGPQDTWVEMGAGRGKGCFWLAHFIGCKVIGIEWIPQFVRRASILSSLFRMDLTFECKNMEQSDLSRATILYLYGNWPEIKIPKGIRVVTISEPLEGAEVIRSFWVRYPWGRTKAFLQNPPS